MTTEVNMPITIRIINNPWPHTVPNHRLLEILRGIAEEAAERIKQRHTAGIYEKPKLAIVILDPTAPQSRPSEDAILAIILIGEGAQDNLCNALSKAFEQRDHGRNIGAMATAHSHLLPDGAFRYGHSFEVDSTMGGASGLTQKQDRDEGTTIASSFNRGIQEAREQWEEATGDPGDYYWFCDQNLPEARVKKAAQLVSGVGIEAPEHLA
jgi:hypothetical protein